ncbi:MAG: Asp-tRNA(Asn)/Glu-tRNA(Gln) amidotransferase GatCAB subunit A [Deltaproteobacteria bacterium CG11_big_fil_rev_8_21_14_0_20_47_16]|nr:MAG: Asp-tRNA(Asn)/Glu-tRNA(Gln) amidotransferase GatCAB subunit A [Deltaproteobacteria bacterium CG11_big_fil_rev_8_21_14_0_20_47_16]
MTIDTLHQQLSDKKISSVELTQDYLKRIATSNPDLNSFITVTEELALADARAADDRIKSGKNVTPLTGIPVGIKDLFTINGVRTTCGSHILENYTAPYTATVVQRLQDAGAVIVGKLNMDEFAMGSSNEHSYFGNVRNPWERDHIPGGSSGGSAAAVAALQCVAALGTDTGGSIRQPASHCGVVGIKPTYGRVSRYGMTAFASSLDQCGPMARTVRDCAEMLNVIAGFDPHDSTSLNLPATNFSADLGKSIKGMKLGIPKEYFIDGLDSDVAKAVEAGIAELKKLGAECVEISLPHTEYALPCYYIVAPAEASANLSRFDGIRFGHRASHPKDLRDLYELSRTEGFGPEVTLRITIGTFVLNSGYYDAYYKKAQQVRTLIKQDFLKAFESVDAIAAPVSPTAAFRFGEKTDDPIQMYLSDIFTIPCNLAGLPGLSVPCGFTKDKLPVGMQLIGKPLAEATILQIAHAYEQATPWHGMLPPGVTL